MDQFERQKQMRRAMNGRMILMCGGAFMIFSAITTTLMYAMNFFVTAQQADKKVAEYVELLEKAGVDSMFLKIAGVCFLVVGICEIVAGFFSIKNCNRVDKSSFTMKILIALLTVEVVMEVYLFFTGLMNLGFLITAILLPAFMLWGTTRLRKIAKEEPDRVYAVENVKKSPKQQTTKPEAKKSIRERAAMQARVEETSAEESPQNGVE